MSLSSLSLSAHFVKLSSSCLMSLSTLPPTITLPLSLFPLACTGDTKMAASLYRQVLMIYHSLPGALMFNQKFTLGSTCSIIIIKTKFYYHAACVLLSLRRQPAAELTSDYYSTIFVFCSVIRTLAKIGCGDKANVLYTEYCINVSP